MAQPLSPDYYKQLEEIQAVDFVIFELVLYLDTHPNDSQAIEQYNHYAAHSLKLKIEFEAKHGPLRFGMPMRNDQRWEWSEAPWPWQV
ncbi:spore coat protein CotJB [Jeotgalibacillus campisalis]|uniref:Spore coat peptide assembly protein CotJB n=1 Tax=Jeotgalibacillus campisalis TaxID=220754 RepID=A0A0C2W3G8_9BACL|nr:spore coat protein CotJB [Jeotgalibacillus campisalis]KIL51171.1 spore coat peptide assembly protein CotJB [Jeotgalibacillus campisalis]